MPNVPQAAPDGGQQAPFGTSSATGPTPNRGYQAAAQQRLGVVVNALTELLPLVGATSEEGAAIMKAINTLAKLVPPGSVTPAAERNAIEQMAMKNQQNTMLAQQMRTQPGATAASGGAPPSMPGMRAA